MLAYKFKGGKLRQYIEGIIYRGIDKSNLNSSVENNRYYINQISLIAIFVSLPMCLIYFFCGAYLDFLITFLFFIIPAITYIANSSRYHDLAKIIFLVFYPYCFILNSILFGLETGSEYMLITFMMLLILVESNKNKIVLGVSYYIVLFTFTSIYIINYPPIFPEGSYLFDRYLFFGIAASATLVSFFTLINRNFLVLNLYKESDQAHSATIKKLRKANEVILSVQENERKRLAMEIHEGLGQNLIVLKNFSGLAKSDSTAIFLTKIIEDLRKITLNLNPRILEKEGLKIAIEKYIENLLPYHSLRLHVEIDKQINTLFDPFITTQIYRIIQECVENTTKHSQASYCELSIKQKGQFVYVQIYDDGLLFDFTEEVKNETKLGLIAVRERVNSINGKVKSISNIKDGNILSIKIPLKKEVPVISLEKHLSTGTSNY